MSDVVIKAENLGKKYTIGHKAENGRYVALRDVLVHNAKNLWHKTKDLASGKPIIQGDTTEEVWALKDLNFEIKCGEAVGIIGRNGAGKSTLLKILSRITEPTTGRVTIDGRVASLLEVGTGFHPELTGRENIYLNGTILGMTRAEIKRKFDEIVAFAEIEKYLDTPVKRYSSGMYVRLAFAVAAHLEPEILVVDEVLAVGDAEFQKKCLGKMGEVAHEGRTVLFVSHNMAAIENLCKKTLLLNRGVKDFEGNTIQALEIYIREPCNNFDLLNDANSRPGSGHIRISRVTFFDNNENITNTFKSGDLILIKVNYIYHSIILKPNFKITIYSSLGQQISNFSTRISGIIQNAIKEDGSVECTIETIPLNIGKYRINIGISDQDALIDHVDMAGYFKIDGGNPYGTGLLPEVGNFIIKPKWKVIEKCE